MMNDHALATKLLELRAILVDKPRFSVELIHAFWLGVIQGITEFLPISSSGHLILLPAITGWTDQGVAFDLAVHVGTLLAVLLYFRRDVASLLTDSLASVIGRRFIGQGKLALFLGFGTVPAVGMGWLLLDLIEGNLRSVAVIFVTTLVFGLLLGWSDWRANKKRTLETLTVQDALLVGLAQAVSLVPGTSRSGITITAALLLGLSREAASRFSFLLAIPITAAAASIKLYEVAVTQTNIDWSAFVVGGAVSFLTALAAIHFFLKWLNHVGMWPYVLYRLVLAAIIYFVLLT